VTSESGALDRNGVDLLTGKGPRTDPRGKFSVDEVPSGKGTAVFMDPDADLTAGAIATVEFELEAGETLDLGTIKGVQTQAVPRDERGTLQLRTQTAGWKRRPRPPGTDLEAEDPEAPVIGDPETDRLWVRSVEIGGVAEQAGLLPGDEIIGIDGQSVETLGAGTAAQMLSDSRLRAGQDV
ncbi:MAG: PDZ domain-containing protein, partial [Myxococcales bacterium]|nr:PDZ domain-containing protein [Myxococcales bacterium]